MKILETHAPERRQEELPMPDWLHNRMQELEHHHADLYFPRFGAIRWIESLAALVDRPQFRKQDLRTFYNNTQRRAHNAPEARLIDTVTYANLLLSFQYYISAKVFHDHADPVSIVRISIMNWYYSIYWSTNAMLTAKTGSHPENHTAVANSYCNQIAAHNLIPQPFSYFAPTLVKADYETHIANTYGATRNPTAHRELRDGLPGARMDCLGALKGTADWYRERCEDEIRSSNAYQTAGFTNFRSNAAKHLRDGVLARWPNVWISTSVLSLQGQGQLS